MNNKIVVFDMDDTLVDSHLRYAESILKVLDEEGIPYEADSTTSIINSLGFPRTAAYYSKMGVPGTIEEIVERMLGSMVKLYTTDVHLMPGVMDYLQQLKAEGARLFALTATPHRITDACLQKNGVYDLFEQVWCTDDFGHAKDETVLFELVAAAIGCQPADILYFDDSITAIRTARAAGLRTCGVCSPLAVENEGMEQVADSCIRSFEELL